MRGIERNVGLNAQHPILADGDGGTDNGALIFFGVNILFDIFKAHTTKLIALKVLRDVFVLV